MSYSTTAAHDSPRPRLLIVDDDPLIRELHTLVLRSEGYEIETADDGAAALERLAVKKFDLVVTDRAMPNLDGASMVLALRSAGSRIPVVMVTGSLAQAPLPPRVAHEVSAALPKPALPADILSAVAHALRGTPRRESLRQFRRLLECEAEPPAEERAVPAPSTAKALRSAETVSLDVPPGWAQGHALRPLPPIVRIVLTQAARHRMRGQITTEVFEAQVQRLVREELEPRGRSMLVHHLPCGTTRFIIKAMATGKVCDLFEIAPEGLASESAGAALLTGTGVQTAAP